MRPGPRETGKPRTFTEAARRAQIIEAAIDTIAEVGFGRASLARIGERVGISKGLIGYHFAGKDDLIEQVVLEVLEHGKAYMRPRIIDAMSTGSGFLRAYIESNLDLMRERRNHMVAIVEIERNGLTADGQERFHGHADAIDEAVQVLAQHLAHYQANGDLRPDFDPNVMAVTIRAATDAVLQRYARDPDLDIDNYAREIVTVFDRATRIEEEIVTVGERATRIEDTP
ncbi:MAG: TetR/AcrR family transcriptional regulator [Acidimicrobiales bacterium]